MAKKFIESLIGTSTNQVEYKPKLNGIVVKKVRPVFVPKVRTVQALKNLKKLMFAGLLEIQVLGVHTH